MNARVLVLICALLAVGLAAKVARSQDSANGIHLFYLHGRIIEDAGPTPTHPDYGLYDYPAIVAALGARGATVISEVRASGTVIEDYAQKTVAEIEALLDAGVAPANIVVAGFSKGGGIATRVSSRLARPDIRFVLLAACSDWIADVPQLRLTGIVYSIFESSDEIGTSCADLANRGNGVTTFQELKISTGQRHGAFYLPRTAWIDPLLDWIHGKDH